MLSQRGYLIHFARLFFAALTLIACSLLLHLWNVYQPFALAFQVQRCRAGLSHRHIPPINVWKWFHELRPSQLLPTFSFVSASMSSQCHSHINENYPLSITKFLRLSRSAALIYLVYHLIRLSLFHAQMRRLREKQRHYARLYRQDRAFRCSKRLLKT